MREKLARAYLATKWCKGTVANIMRGKTERALWWREKQEAFEIVDAILDALMEPSEEMCIAAMGMNRPDKILLATAIWQAMLREAKKAAPAHEDTGAEEKRVSGGGETV